MSGEDVLSYINSVEFFIKKLKEWGIFTLSYHPTVVWVGQGLAPAVDFAEYYVTIALKFNSLITFSCV